MPHKDPEERRRYKHEWYLRKKAGEPTRTREFLSPEEAVRRRRASNRKWMGKERVRRRTLLRLRFGKNCFFCDWERSLLMHEKHGRRHRDLTQMTKAEFANVVEGDDFVRVCLRCHKTVHWCMDYLGLAWEEIEARFASVVPRSSSPLLYV